MGYHLTTQDAHPRETPKPHTPVSRMQVAGHRHYNPELGRWISRDPIGEVGSGLMRKARPLKKLTPNTLLFVDNCPVSNVDVLGLFSDGDSFDLTWPSGAELGTVKIATYKQRPAGSYPSIFGWAGARLKVKPRIKRKWKKCYIFRWRQKVWAYDQDGVFFYVGTDMWGNELNKSVDGSWFDGAELRGDGTEWYYSTDERTGFWGGVSSTKTFYDVAQAEIPDWDGANTRETMVLQLELVAVYPNDVSIASGGMSVWKDTWGFSIDEANFTLLDSPATP